MSERSTLFQRNDLNYSLLVYILMKTELVENALKDWLPSQEEFDNFAREENQSPEASGRTPLDTTETAAKSKKG